MNDGLRLRFTELCKHPAGEVVDLTEEMEHEIGVAIKAGLPDYEIEWMKLEENGGLCMKCGKQWKQVHVKNRICEFDYHKPDCRCFVLCPFCEQPLYREMIGGFDHCLTCEVHLRCTKFVDKIVQGKSGGTATKRRKCGGILKVKSNGSLTCEDCGEDVTRITKGKGEDRKVFTYPAAGEQPRRASEPVEEKEKPVLSKDVIAKAVEGSKRDSLGIVPMATVEREQEEEIY